MIKSKDCLCDSAYKACGCPYDCENQEYWVEDGFIMSCDVCGHAGLVESDGWIGILDGHGRCAVYCSETCAGEENMKIYHAA
jgi:hypothetical protein